VDASSNIFDHDSYSSGDIVLVAKQRVLKPSEAYSLYY